MTTATLILSATSCPVQVPFKYYPPTDHLTEVLWSNPRLHFSSLPYLSHTIPTSFLNHCNISSKMHTVKFIMQCTPVSCHFLPPWPQYSLQYPVQHFQSVCISQCVSHSHNNDNTVNNILLHLRQSYVTLVVRRLLLLPLHLLIPCCPFRHCVYSATVILISWSFLIPC
jgi:hypothetical protein